MCPCTHLVHTHMIENTKKQDKISLGFARSPQIPSHPSDGATRPVDGKRLGVRQQSIGASIDHMPGVMCSSGPTLDLDLDLLNLLIISQQAPPSVYPMSLSSASLILQGPPIPAHNLSSSLLDPTLPPIDHATLDLVCLPDSETTSSSSRGFRHSFEANCLVVRFSAHRFSARMAHTARHAIPSCFG